jgi:hypothetical protein
VLRVSVPAERLRAALKDGPFTIDQVQVYRLTGNSLGDRVAGSVRALTTAAYKRAGWDRGAVFGEEEVRLRPVRAGKSGKYRALEVVWEAVSEGGSCSWTGDLSVDNVSVHLIQSGDLRPGRNRFVYEFDAGGWAREAGKAAGFHGIVNCEDGSAGAASAYVPLRVNPREFEPWGTAMPVVTQWMVRTTVGRDEGARAELETRGRAPGQVQYRLTSVPKGLNAMIQGADLLVAAGVGVAPGRYYIEVDGVSGRERGTGTVVVDVVTAVPPKPEGKHSAGAATARGIRPDGQGRFQTVEVLWPVDVPGGNCGWDGALMSEGAAPGNMTANAYLQKRQVVLPLVFPGSVVGNSGKTNWVFRGHIVCGNSGTGKGVTRETKLTLEPARFAKRPGLPLWSTMVARVGSGGFALAELSVKSGVAEKADFQVLSIPKGITVKIMRTSRFKEHHSMLMEVWADEQVAEGRYYLPAMVRMGSETGTTDLVVDVVRE